MSTNGKPIPEMRDSDLRRFWAKVALPNDNTGCMAWVAGKTRTGYGHFCLAGSAYFAHRISWTLANGEIPYGMVLDHVVCQNKSCVNPEHLRVCTQRENLTAPDGCAFVYAYKTHCPQGHEYSEVNTYRDPRGKRHCRACSRARDRGRYHRSKLKPDS